MQFFLSCLYAEPSQLGWDPTMVPLRDGHNFDITIRLQDHEPRTYRTLRLLSDGGRQRLLARSTRVWEAVLLEGGEPVGEPLALKDTWTDPAYVSEGFLSEAARLAYGSATHIGTKPLWEDYFLTVLWHTDVILDGEPQVLDCTRSFRHSSGDSPPYHAPQNRSHLWGHTEKPSTAGRHTLRRVHYRIAFAQLGTSLLAERSPCVILRSLAESVRGRLPVTFIPALHADLLIVMKHLD